MRQGRQGRGGLSRGRSVAGTGHLVALIVVFETVGPVKAARLNVAGRVAFAIANRGGQAVVCARLLPPLQAVAGVPAARGAEACLVAKVVANPLWLAVDGAAAVAFGLAVAAAVAVAAVKEAGLYVAPRVALAIAEREPLATRRAERGRRVFPRALEAYGAYRGRAMSAPREWGCI